MRLFDENRDCIRVVLLSMRMERIDGPGTLYQLRKFDSGLPVVLLWSSQCPYTRDELQAMGPAHVFEEPLEEPEVEQVMRRLARGRPARRPGLMSSASET